LPLITTVYLLMSKLLLSLLPYLKSVLTCHMSHVLFFPTLPYLIVHVVASYHLLPSPTALRDPGNTNTSKTLTDTISTPTAAQHTAITSQKQCQHQIQQNQLFYFQS